MTPDDRRRADALTRELRAIVAGRLRAVVVFGAHAADGHRASNDPVRTLAVIDALAFADLEACARRAGAWARDGLATPLLIASDEFSRSLDAFPIEFGAILSQHVVVFGPNPFEGLSAGADDLRRACEVQARSHLLHLREGYLETHGDPASIHDLVVRSAAPLSALLVNVARIDGVTATTAAAQAAYVERIIGPAPVLRDVLAFTGDAATAADTARLYASYLDAVERLVRYIDRWRAAS
jgi:hypothetical protein